MLRKFLLLCCLVTPVVARSADPPPAESTNRGDVKLETGRGRTDVETNAVPSWRALNRWSFQSGVAFITRSTIDEIGTGGLQLAKGDAGGQIYLTQISYKLAEL